MPEDNVVNKVRVPRMGRLGIHPLPFERQKRCSARRAVLEEFSRRSGDFNVGGSARRPLVTACRENAIQIACYLADSGDMKPRQLRALGTGAKTLSILSRNVYGWFSRVGRGQEDVTPKGARSLGEVPRTGPPLPFAAYGAGRGDTEALGSERRIVTWRRGFAGRSSGAETSRKSVVGVYMEAITFAKNEAYSREVAFHTRKGCHANVQARDDDTGCCYKNGGQPLWGYRARHVQRGQEKQGRPIIKSIWELDNQVVAGRPVHEWVRYCLVELADRKAERRS